MAQLDTDVASLLHRNKFARLLTTRLIGREPLITFVTLGELTKLANPAIGVPAAAAAN